MQADIQLNRLRNETPACKNLIHFNNAGCSLSPAVVVESVIQHLRLEQEIGGYEAAEQAIGSVENFYTAFSSLLNCDSKEIAYIENATRAWDMAFYSIPFRTGDRVLTGQAEYASNYLAMLQMQKRAGIDIVVIPNDEHGSLCVDVLESEINDKVKLIALTHIPSQSGAVQPAEEVGKIARQHNILYLLDACQSAGQVPLDVKRIGCDMLTGTGRKYLRGPRGTGFLYMNSKILERVDPPFIDMLSANWTAEDRFEFRADARRFENWECFVAGKIGLGAAVDYALKVGLENINHRIAFLAQSLIRQLKALDNVTVYESGATVSGIITFNKANESAGDLQQRLRNAGINTGVSKRSNALIDYGRRRLELVNRASIHYYNSEEELARFVDALSGK